MSRVGQPQGRPSRPPPTRHRPKGAVIHPSYPPCQTLASYGPSRRRLLASSDAIAPLPVCTPFSLHLPSQALNLVTASPRLLGVALSPCAQPRPARSWASPSHSGAPARMDDEAHPHELPAPKQPALEADRPVHRRCIHIFLVALSLPQDDAPLEAPTPSAAAPRRRRRMSSHSASCISLTMSC